MSFLFQLSPHPPSYGVEAGRGKPHKQALIKKKIMIFF